jgi:Na+-transporting NADH:ubiquinone oxidoreductase subunit D
MIMPPGAFFMLAVFVWVVKGVIIPEEEDKK